MAASLRQKASATSIIASVAATFGSTPVAGNLLIAAVTTNIGTGSTAITGFSTATSVAVGVAGGLVIFYKVSAGNETTITATGTLATLMDLHIFEYSGIDNASPLDKVASTADGGAGVTSRASGTTATLTQANELAFAAIATAGANGGNVSWSNSYVAETTTTDLQTADLITAATTATSSTATWNTSQRAAGAIATFFGETGDNHYPKIQVRPRVPVINWQNPITKGLVFCQPLFENGGTQPVDLVSKNKATTFTNTPTWIKDAVGSMISYNGAATNGPTVDTVTGATFRSTTRFSYCFFQYRVGDTSAPSGRIAQETDGTSAAQVIYDNNVNVIFQSGVRSTLGVWNYALPANKTLNFWVFTYDSSNTANVPIAYMNGAVLTLVSSTTPVGALSANLDTHLTVGNIKAGGNVSNRTYNGYLSDVCKWNRILTPQEVVELSAYPWRIYTQPGLLSQMGPGI